MSNDLDIVAIDVPAIWPLGVKAKALLDRFDRDEWSMRLPKANRDAVAALVAAADGRIDDATRLISMAQDVVSANSDRFHQAWVLLIGGEVHRRARRRAMARAAFADAAAMFDGLGSKLWARLAREHLARIDGTGGGPQGLTPTQLRVAELVIEGLTNRQVADCLFMSPHTVEAHLTAIYRKLGIRSRAELGTRLPGARAAPSRDSRRAARDRTSAESPKE